MDDERELAERLRALAVFAGELPSFDPAAAPEEPAVLFRRWLEQAIAAGVREPHAVTLSTVDADGAPNARMLILKGVGARSWRFAGHRTSVKGRELDGDPRAALTFYWSPVGRQVRIRGRVTPASPAESARDFLARSTGARVEALAGRQGEPVNDPAEMDEALAAARRRLAEDHQIVAESWTVYDLTADAVEFWQADHDRRHVRLRYERAGEGWRRQRLWS